MYVFSVSGVRACSVSQCNTKSSESKFADKTGFRRDGQRILAWPGHGMQAHHSKKSIRGLFLKLGFGGPQGFAVHLPGGAMKKLATKQHLTKQMDILYACMVKSVLRF